MARKWSSTNRSCRRASSKKTQARWEMEDPMVVRFQPILFGILTLLSYSPADAGTPRLHDDHTVLTVPGSNNGVVVSGQGIAVVDLERGTTRWTLKAREVREAWPLMQSDGLLVLLNESLVLLDRNSGVERWRREVRGAPCRPIELDGKLFLGEGASLVALDAQSGGVLWTTAAVGEVTSIASLGTDIVAGTRDGYITVVLRESGLLLLVARVGLTVAELAVLGDVLAVGIEGPYLLGLSLSGHVEISKRWGLEASLLPDPTSSSLPLKLAGGRVATLAEGASAPVVVGNGPAYARYLSGHAMVLSDGSTTVVHLVGLPRKTTIEDISGSGVDACSGPTGIVVLTRTLRGSRLTLLDHTGLVRWTEATDANEIFACTDRIVLGGEAGLKAIDLAGRESWRRPWPRSEFRK